MACGQLAAQGRFERRACATRWGWLPFRSTQAGLGIMRFICKFSVASFVLGSLPMLAWILMSVSNPHGIFPFGMVCATGGVLASPLPVILAIIARRRIQQSEGALNGMRLAKAGMILPFVPAAIMIPWYLLAM